MSPVPELPAIDEEPQSGVYIDHDTIPLTDDEAVEGNEQGEKVDVDDDEDNGLR